MRRTEVARGHGRRRIAFSRKLIRRAPCEAAAKSQLQHCVCKKQEDTNVPIMIAIFVVGCVLVD
jgi:hypothetical protein